MMTADVLNMKSKLTKTLESKLSDLCGGEIRVNESMQNWTTFKCRARAKVVVSPPSIDSLTQTVRWLSKNKISWHVIGRGSNLLIKDGGVSNVLIDLSHGFSKIEMLNRKNGEGLVRVEAGVPNGTLLNWLKDKLLGGFEFAFGIPGSIGGGIRMNAGTPQGWFSQVLTEVEWVNQKGKVEKTRVTEKDFTYRDFPAAREKIIVAATMRFKEREIQAIEAEIEEAKKSRLNQPLQWPNIGSVFKNPTNDYAGRLVEAAGLKGARKGDAEISTAHANFIINRGEATTRDVLDLIFLAQETVRLKFNVQLEPEVHLIGDDE